MWNLKRGLEAEALPVARDAARMDPDTFMRVAIARLAKHLPCQHMLYGTGTVKHGTHTLAGNGHSCSVETMLQNSDFPFPLPLPALEKLGETLSLKKSMSAKDYMTSELLVQYRDTCGLNPTYFIVDNSAFSSILDFLIVFDEDPDASLSEFEQKLLMQIFCIMRLGLSVAIHAYHHRSCEKFGTNQITITERAGHSYIEQLQPLLRIQSDNSSELENGISKFGHPPMADNDILVRPTGQFNLLIGLNNLLGNLSEREKQVVARISYGFSYKTVAVELGISTSTVGNMVARIKKKLDVSSKEELIQLLTKEKATVLSERESYGT